MRTEETALHGWKSGKLRSCHCPKKMRGKRWFGGGKKEKKWRLGKDRVSGKVRGKIEPSSRRKDEGGGGDFEKLLLRRGGKLSREGK